MTRMTPTTRTTPTPPAHPPRGAAPAILLTLAAATLAAAPALAQSNVDPLNKYSWSENTGWTNWRDANATAQGARFSSAYASGFVWAENIGWINLGDGTPANGTRYANVNGADFGVNIEADGNLSGYAWGENVGWINFNTSATLGPFGQQARAQRFPERLRGYAWGENIGWINLDSAVATKFVGFVSACKADFDRSGEVNANDISAYLNQWYADIVNGTVLADYNLDGETNANDISDYINDWYAAIVAGGAC